MKLRDNLVGTKEPMYPLQASRMNMPSFIFLLLSVTVPEKHDLSEKICSICQL